MMNSSQKTWLSKFCIGPSSRLYLATVFFIFIVLIVLAVLLTFSAHWRSSGPKASEGTKYIYHFIGRKWQTTHEIRNRGSAIIVIGGSSSLYSIRASMIERSLAVPALNWGIQADLGLDYLLFNAQRVLLPGDVALLALEYEQYFVTEPSWTLADYVIPYDPGYLLSLGFKNILPVINKLTAIEYFQRMTDWAPRNPYVAASILETVNDNGDFIKNHPSDQKDYHRQSLNRYTPLDLSVTRSEQIDKIKKFVVWCRSRNIQVVAGYPALLDDPWYERPSAVKFFSSIDKFYRDLGVQVLGVPSDYFFPKSLFFDTRYHLNSLGAKAMTAKIITHLAQFPWVADHANKVGMMNAPITLDFTAVGYPGHLEKVEGLAGREAWGRWTDGSRATFHFVEALPKHFALEIAVHSAFAQNANRPITIHIGNVEKHFSVPEHGKVVSIPFALSSEAHTIELMPPFPLSPKELGMGEDTRRLGIGLKSLRIIKDES